MYIFILFYHIMNLLILNISQIIIFFELYDKFGLYIKKNLYTKMSKNVETIHKGWSEMKTSI